jgi:hypothetical protein
VSVLFGKGIQACMLHNRGGQLVLREPFPVYDGFLIPIFFFFFFVVKGPAADAKDAPQP